MTIGLVGISSVVFIAVAGALIGAATSAVFKHYSHQSITRALVVGFGVAVLGMVGLTSIAGVTDDGTSGNTSAEVSPREPPTETVLLDKDKDGIPDSVDECPNERGIKPSGCPVKPKVTSLSALIEQGSREYQNTENAPPQQITVGGITDPMGIRMQVGGAHRSASFTIPTNREFQTIRGRVGIASEPCSAGSVGYIAIRNADGQLLWPDNGELRPVHRDAVPFKVRIAGEDAVVLYAESPEPEGGYCGSYAGTTEVGWVHTQLISTG